MDTTDYKTYEVRQSRDAWQIYTAYVSAETPEDALKIAQESNDVKWVEGDVETFDDRHFEVLDPEGSRYDVLASTFP
jgi:hypothetical protein